MAYRPANLKQWMVRIMKHTHRTYFDQKVATVIATLIALITLFFAIQGYRMKQEIVGLEPTVYLVVSITAFVFILFVIAPLAIFNEEMALKHAEIEKLKGHYLFHLKQQQGYEVGKYIYCHIDDVRYSEERLRFYLLLINYSVFAVTNLERIHNFKLKIDGESFLLEPLFIEPQRISPGSAASYYLDLPLNSTWHSKLQKNQQCVSFSIGIEWPFRWNGQEKDDIGETSFKQVINNFEHKLRPIEGY